MWLKNALVQANRDDSWHLNKRIEAKSGRVHGLILLAGLLFIIGVVLLSK